MIQNTWKRICSYILTFTMILSICTWNIGGESIKAEASEVETAETAVTLSNPKRDSNGNVTYDCVWFGRYPQSDATGKKKDAIKWRVLSVNGNDAFLMADRNLDCKPYNTTWAGVTWETCTLRSWLNGYNASYNSNHIDYSSNNFIDKAFTSAEQDAIKKVTVVNNRGPWDVWGYAEGGNNTKDKIFLLSVVEAHNADYGFSSFDMPGIDTTRKRKNTAYAEKQGAYEAEYWEFAKYTGEGFWWLRTPGESNYKAAYAYGDDGYSYGTLVDYEHAICPALHLNLSSDVWSYAGTVCTDGTVKTKTPAKKGTTLTVSKNNIKVKVTSSSKSNPTVAVTKVVNSSAKNVTIPATVTVRGVKYKVTKIADNAFKGNKKLKNVTIGSNVKSIGKNAFSGCTSLTKVTIGKNVTAIGSKAFYKCKRLKSITIQSKKIKTIGKHAFKGINKKASFTLKGTNSTKKALKKKLKKTSVGYVKTWKFK